MSLSAGRAGIVAVWQAAVDAVHGETLLRRHSGLRQGVWQLELPGRTVRIKLPAAGGGGRLRVIGIGKAAASLARGVEAVLGAEIDAGLVVVKAGHGEPLSRCRVLEAGHPLPDARSAQAAAALLEFIGRPTAHDLFLVLLTGGASALVAAPVAGLYLADKAAVTEVLVRSGASIGEINVVRRHLSRIKGGQLARALAPAASYTLAISDVLGNDPATIGSGPTVPDASSFVEALQVVHRYGLETRIPESALNYLQAGAAGAYPDTPKAADPAFSRTGYAVVATLEDAIAAAARAAAAAGFEVIEHPLRLEGDTAARAREFAGRLRSLASGRSLAAPPLLLLAGGETTLQVRGTGRGGRNQEFAVVAAEALEGTRGLEVLAAGTDGTDGPTEAAGGFADGQTLARARRAGLDPRAILQNNDSHRLLLASGDLFVTGPTGTNVMDLVLGVASTSGNSPPGLPLP